MDLQLRGMDIFRGDDCLNCSEKGAALKEKNFIPSEVNFFLFRVD